MREARRRNCLLLRGYTRHIQRAGLHESVDWIYTAWISAGMLEFGEQHRLLSQTRQLKQLYSEHIQIEETVVFPLAAQLLNGQALAAMGSEFIARRK